MEPIKKVCSVCGIEGTLIPMSDAGAVIAVLHGCKCEYNPCFTKHNLTDKEFQEIKRILEN